jgi:hypothetical protein
MIIDFSRYIKSYIYWIIDNMSIKIIT